MKFEKVYSGDAEGESVVTCVAGCQCYTGGEIRHHNLCPFYPDSMTALMDIQAKTWNAELETLRAQLTAMTAERDKLLSDIEAGSMPGAYARLKNLQNAERERDRMRDALKEIQSEINRGKNKACLGCRNGDDLTYDPTTDSHSGFCRACWRIWVGGKMYLLWDWQETEKRITNTALKGT